MSDLPSREEERQIQVDAEWWWREQRGPKVLSGNYKHNSGRLQSALDAIRAALGMPDASAEKMVDVIARLVKTIDFLSNTETVKAVAAGIEDINADRCKSLEQVQAECEAEALAEKALGYCDENATLRKLLWLRHGHQGLYGDDGEMQCSECSLDFKRMPVTEIQGRFEERALLILSEGIKPGGSQ